MYSSGPNDEITGCHPEQAAGSAPISSRQCKRLPVYRYTRKEQESPPEVCRKPLNRGVVTLRVDLVRLLIVCMWPFSSKKSRLGEIFPVALLLILQQ